MKIYRNQISLTSRVVTFVLSSALSGFANEALDLLEGKISEDEVTVTDLLEQNQEANPATT